MKTVLITGINGFIGKHIIKSLKSTSCVFINNDQINKINFCDWGLVRNLDKADVILHLASKNFIPESFKKPRQFYDNNIKSTLNILEKAKRDNAKVIFFSTYVYGDPNYNPIDENHVIDAMNPYSQSKIICEQLCRSYVRDFGVSVTIFRPFNIYGYGQNLNYFIPKIINQLNNELIKMDDPSPKRDFIHINDVVSAVSIVISKKERLCKTYNLGTGVSTSVGEVAKMIIKLSKSSARLVFSDKVRKGEIFDTMADIKKIKNELGWEPMISLKKGLKIIIDEHQKT